MLTDEFKRELRYIVFKLKDIVAYLPKMPSAIGLMERVIHEGRLADGKSDFRCVVVESDWPEYEPTWKAIEARMTGRAIEAEVRAEAQEPAKARFNRLMGDEKETPIERLRFFCSLAMNGQDWIDVEPFFDALAAAGRPAPCQECKDAAPIVRDLMLQVIALKDERDALKEDVAAKAALIEKCEKALLIERDIYRDNDPDDGETESIAEALAAIAEHKKGDTGND